MTKLAIATDPPASLGPVTRVGGWPSLPRAMIEPRCGRCGRRALFLAQILLGDIGVADLADRDQLLLLFQCPARRCDTVALLVPAAGPVEEEPPGPAPLRAVGVTLETVADGPVQGYRSAYEKACVEDSRRVIGKFGGRPEWIEAAQEVVCACGREMTFVAQFDDTAAEGLDFGPVGMLYAFVCAACPDRARCLLEC